MGGGWSMEYGVWSMECGRHQTCQLTAHEEFDIKRRLQNHVVHYTVALVQQRLHTTLTYPYLFLSTVARATQHAILTLYPIAARLVRFCSQGHKRQR